MTDRRSARVSGYEPARLSATPSPRLWGSWSNDHRVRIGNVFEDIGEGISDAADGAKEFVSDVIDKIPGAAWVGKVASDIANSDFGQFMLTAMASSLYGPLAWQIGPQAASVIWAMPGMIKGDAFGKAYIKEWCRRVEKTAEFFAGDVGDFAGQQASDLLNSQFGSAGTFLLDKAEQLKSVMPDLDTDAALARIDMTPMQLAYELGIRPDVAAFALAAARKSADELFAAQNQYDMRTGTMEGVMGNLLFPGPDSPPRTACQTLDDLRKQFVSNFTLLDLVEKGCKIENAKARAFAVTHQSASDLRTTTFSRDFASVFGNVPGMGGQPIRSTMYEINPSPVAVVAPPPPAPTIPDVVPVPAPTISAAEEEALRRTAHAGLVKALNPMGSGGPGATGGSLGVPILVGGALIAVGALWFGYLRHRF